MNDYDDDSDGEDVTSSLQNIATTSLINVRQFQFDYFTALTQKTDDFELDELQNEIDISTDDIKPKTHYERVEESIKQSVCNIVYSAVTINTNNNLKKKIDPTDSPFSTPMLTENSSPIMTSSPIIYNPTIRGQHNNNNNNNLNIDPIDLVSEDEVIINFSIYHPCKSLKVQEIAVLGSQRLSELKDKIYCMRDRILDGEKRKSSYFFINNTFYNDTRNPLNIKYSDTILNWLASKGKGFEYQEKNMQDEIFLNLTLSIGEKYLYCNQGNCEHYVIVNKIRLITNNDSHKRSDYPTTIHQLKVRRRKCKICEIYPSKFVTIGDKLVDETPYFFCEECYRMFHYTKEGALIYSDFKVYPYFHE